MDFEHVIKQLILKGHVPEGKTCPGDEKISYYLDNLLDNKEKEAMESHLSVCDSCLEVVTACSSLKDEHKSSKALSFLSDLVLSFSEAGAKILRLAEDMVVFPEPEALPARGRLLWANVVRFRRDMIYFDVEVEIEKQASELAEMRFKISKNGISLNDIRVTLVSNGRDTASDLTREGYVGFEDIRFGMYILKFYRKGHYCGEISFEVKEG